MELTPQDVVVEIGPGKGILTELLIEKVAQVIAIEIDNDLFEYLTKEFAYTDQLTLLNKDFLEISIEELKSYSKSEYPKVVANIPYYITTPIIMKLLNEPSYKVKEISPSTKICEDIFIMVQAEVAKRILAKPGNKDYGKLTISVQYAAEVELIDWIDRTYFDPVPKVDSAIIRLKPRIESPFKIHSMKTFWHMVNSIFQSRRKTLRNSLKRMGLEHELLDLLDNQFNLNTRGETLSIENMTILANEIFNYKNS